jgi:hypothetical protein
MVKGRRIRQAKQFKSASEFFAELATSAGVTLARQVVLTEPAAHPGSL